MTQRIGRSPFGSLSPIGGEGWGEGAGRAFASGIALVAGLPLIPTFSPKGEKESDDVRDILTADWSNE